MKTYAKQRKVRRRHAKAPARKSRVPSLRFHKASGQMYVVLSGRAIYCGKPDDPATEQRYHQAVTEWLSCGRQLPDEPNSITVKEVLTRFWIYAKGYYRTLTDGRNKELEQYQLALRPLKELFGETPAVEFGPRALKTVRRNMIDRGWSRPYINKQINRIRHMFKWAVSDELIPSAVLHALRSVVGLRKRRSDAPEPEPVRPVSTEKIEAVRPFVSAQVWAIIQLQRFTAARAGEICRMRPCDIDRDGKVWVYTPHRHKTAWHGHVRKIYIGPRGQEALSPFLLREAESYCFSPAEAEAQRRKRLSENRTTPMSCGNVPGSNVRSAPKRSAGERYTTDTYRRAIQRACEKAFPPPEPLARCEGETKAQWQKRLTQQQKAELKAWRKAHRWHPHQLRHNAATELRKEFGLETARIILGHRSPAITEVYAETNEKHALEAMMKVG